MCPALATVGMSVLEVTGREVTVQTTTAPSPTWALSAGSHVTHVTPAGSWWQRVPGDVGKGGALGQALSAESGACGPAAPMATCYHVLPTFYLHFPKLFLFQILSNRSIGYTALQCDNQ